MESGDRYLREGENITLTCRATGFPTPAIRWKFNEAFITSSNPRFRNQSSNGVGTLTISGARKDDEGTYECVAENAINYVHSNSAIKLRVKCKYNLDN